MDKKCPTLIQMGDLIEYKITDSNPKAEFISMKKCHTLIQMGDLIEYKITKIQMEDLFPKK